MRRPFVVRAACPEALTELLNGHVYETLKLHHLSQFLVFISACYYRVLP
jgi:hypothetical protein